MDAKSGELIDWFNMVICFTRIIPFKNACIVES